MGEVYRLKGKTALISGAGRNNGRTIALTFAREGADVILVARQRAGELNAVAEQCRAMGVKALPVIADMSQYGEVSRVVNQGLEHFGKVDVSVSVAGVRSNKLPWDYTIEEWHNIFAINLHSTFYLAKALAPGMIARRSGSFIALGGNSAVTASFPYVSALAASKHGLHGLIKGLAHAFGPYNVRANLLSLANIQNNRQNPEWYQYQNDKGEFVHTGQVGDPTTSDAERNKLSVLGRQGTQQEVANVAVFLASDESSYVTGDRIICSGGGYM
jgi:NAD(P)-dependent dehydrogenase (short-subunit alcohol dehydrogenase family)